MTILDDIRNTARQHQLCYWQVTITNTTNTEGDTHQCDTLADALADIRDTLDTLKDHTDVTDLDIMPAASWDRSAHTLVAEWEENGPHPRVSYWSLHLHHGRCYAHRDDIIDAADRAPGFNGEHLDGDTLHGLIETGDYLDWHHALPDHIEGAHLLDISPAEVITAWAVSEPGPWWTPNDTPEEN